MGMTYLWHNRCTKAVHVVEGLSLLLYVGMLDELGKVLLIDACAEGVQKVSVKCH